MKKVLMIVGSLRKDSFNRRLAGEIEAILGDRAQVSYLDYSDLPFMDQDIEFPAPESVTRVRSAVQEADGIWICSPEYNFRIPGVLKNLLDWLSRSLIPNDPERRSAAKGKFVTVSGAAGKSGGAGVRKDLFGLLQMMSMELISGMGTGIVLGDAFVTGEMKLSEADRAALAAQAEEFLSAI